MLFFLALAANLGWRVECYRDHAIGTLAKDPGGRLVMTEVVLRPEVMLSGEAPPGATEIAALHHRAHEQCFIANSVKTLVRVEPQRM
jgi:organic hydroperoxide reductase OsmC/OhrA